MSVIAREWFDTLFSATAVMSANQNSAYDAGYKMGYEMGRPSAQMLHMLLPYIGIALLVLLAWFGWCAWSRRRGSRGQR